MKVRAPGKLILSGEHAIVHGLPALAMAVNRYAEAQASAQRLPIVSFDCSDLAYSQALRFAALERLKGRIKEKYHRFLRGEFKIRRVLQKPMELAQFALSLFFEVLNVSPAHGVKIKLQSDIPMSCGMGSSAATILAVIHAIAYHLELSLPEELFFRLGLETENLQHGRSSGLDLRISQQGGCFLLRDNQMIVRPIPSFPFYLVNTGIPHSSTGECVASVADFFKQSRLRDDFAFVTEKMDQALQNNAYSAFQEMVRHNHQLLVEIGVVPEKVQGFIAALEKIGAAAKICGAGAVAGDRAGIVLVVTTDVSTLIKLCSHYHYNLLPVTAEARGVHVV